MSIEDRIIFTILDKLSSQLDERELNNIIVGMKNRMFQEGLMMESITFHDWIQEIEKIK